eukprot:CAMPEP_0182609402 /NCGR_PEP_ID=MMETSP1330-20130603/3503_1 /TAXON_ID=464278 /ORGANISM="Picochlorum sp., Strain RCC944" /LENGTH=122 /DNA_ID=CAMNT_0024828261 /DNA_START=113 /DNA_END=478 /DNA_ORIENTATION=-
MVLTRSTKKGSASRNARSPGTTDEAGGRAAPAAGAGPVAAGAAFTLPSDEARMRQFRSQFLSTRRTWRHRVSTFWAQVEVHSGAYMFDVREHVIFYALLAAIVFLVGKSLLTLILRRSGATR